MLLLNNLRFYIKHLQWKLLWIALISSLFSLVDALSLALLVPFYQWAQWHVLHPQAPYVWTVQQAGIHLQLSLDFIQIACLVVAGFALKAMVRYWDLQYRAAVNAFLQRRLRELFFKGLNRVSYAAFVQFDKSTLQNVATHNIQELYYGYQHTITAIQNAIFVVVFLGLSLWIAPLFTLTLLLGSALVYGIFFLASAKAQHTSKQWVRLQNAYVHRLSDWIDQYAYLKATKSAHKLLSQIQARIQEIYQNERKMALWLARLSSWREPMYMGLLMLSLGIFFTYGKGQLGGILPALMYSYKAFGCLLAGHQAIMAMYKFSGPLQQYDQMMQALQKAQEIEQNTDVFSLQDRLQLHDIHLDFPAHPKVLNGIHLDIKAGQMIALIGPSGAGKTTLTQILLGLYSPTRGQMIWDGVPVTPERQQTLRGQVGWVQQQLHLFDDTLFNNVSLWDTPNVETQARFENAMQAVGLLDWVQQLPEGMHHEVGHQGQRLSGGEKQRVAMAREMYHQRSLLILDEPTSALDAGNERDMQQLLQRLKQHTTLVVIAHRLSTVQQADLIYFMDQGQIVATGTHQELLAQFPRYQQWIAWQNQTDQ